MTESEAIEKLKNMRLYMQIEDENNDCKFTEDDYKANEMAIQALEKQIPKKPILKHDVSVMHINTGNQPHEWKRLESDNWHCPECDSFVGERVYVHGRHHNQRKKKYCDNCGQKLDWSDERKEIIYL